VQQEFLLDDWGPEPSVRDRWLRTGLRRFADLGDRFREVIEFPFDVATWETSLDVMIASGLHSHDAIHVATARRHGLAHIATADDHFRRVSGGFAILLIQDGTHP